jgi:hypothetical protein
MVRTKTGYLILLRLPQGYLIFFDEVTGQPNESTGYSLYRLPGYLIFSIVFMCARPSSPARPISRARAYDYYENKQVTR